MVFDVCMCVLILYSFLNQCRPLSVSMGNAIKYLKNQIMHMPLSLNDEQVCEIFPHMMLCYCHMCYIPVSVTYRCSVKVETIQAAFRPHLSTIYVDAGYCYRPPHFAFDELELWL